MTGRIYIGIDPGKHGGIAVIYPDRASVHETPMLPDGAYDEQAMTRILRTPRSAVAGIERQQAFPKQGGVSNFTTGLGFGLWRGMLAALGIDYAVVAPRDWRNVVGLTKGDDKVAAVALAAQLFPEVAGLLTGPRGGLRDGLAEALLIAEYRKTIDGF